MQHKYIGYIIYNYIYNYIYIYKYNYIYIYKDDMGRGQNRNHKSSMIQHEKRPQLLGKPRAMNGDIVALALRSPKCSGQTFCVSKHLVGLGGDGGWHA